MKRIDAAAFLPQCKARLNVGCIRGHGDAAKLHGRMLRLGFDQACRVA